MLLKKNSSNGEAKDRIHPRSREAFRSQRVLPHKLLETVQECTRHKRQAKETYLERRERAENDSGRDSREKRGGERKNEKTSVDDLDDLDDLDDHRRRKPKKNAVFFFLLSEHEEK